MNIKHDDLLNIAIGKSRRETNWKNTEMLWSDFLKKIEQTTRTAETYNDYINSKKERQDEIKDVGGFVGGYVNGGRRKAENIINRQLITLDIDFGSMDLWESFELIYGCAGAIYSTHKHSPTQQRLRLIIPLDRPVFTDEYQAIARRIAGDLGIEYFDDSTYEPSRLMYWPSTAKDGEYIFKYEDAEWLNADDILNRYFDWKDVSSWPQSTRVSKKVERSAKKQGDPLEKDGLIGAFCRSYNIHEAIETFLSGIYSPCSIDNRYTYVQGSTTAGVVIYDDVFAYSHHGTDPVGGKLCNAFDLVRIHKFGLKDEDAKEGTPSNRMPSYMAMTEFIAKDNRTKRQLSIERLQEAQDDFSEIEIEEEAEWMSKLETDKKGNLKNTIENAKIIFNNDKALKDVFNFDGFEKREVKLKKLPWFNPETDSKYMVDADDAEIRGYFEKIYNITTWAKIKDALDSVIMNNSFHPVRDYLDGLKWDNIKRLDTILIDYLGAEDNEYVQTVTRKALVACVARVFQPGIKFDYVLTLIGNQGIGKSTILRKLGGKWYTDSFTTVQGKEAFEQIQGVWIVEIGELAGLKKAEVEAIKLFISKQTDRYRVPYHRRVDDFPRQCVFFGTTNTINFLKDHTGNRRFWPVDCGKQEIKKNIHNITDYEIDQIWAETIEMYKNGENLYLPKELEEVAAENQKSHKETNEMEGIIAEYLERDLPSDWYEKDIYARRNHIQGTEDFTENKHKNTIKRKQVCAGEIWFELFNGLNGSPDRRSANEIYNALRNIEGWTEYDTAKNQGRIRFGVYYGQQKAFVREEI